MIVSIIAQGTGLLSFDFSAHSPTLTHCVPMMLHVQSLMDAQHYTVKTNLAGCSIQHLPDHTRIDEDACLTFCRDKAWITVADVPSKVL